MLSIETALQLMLDHTLAMPEEEMALSVAAGRVLQRPTYSDLDLPPFDRSRMDGVTGMVEYAPEFG